MGFPHIFLGTMWKNPVEKPADKPMFPISQEKLEGFSTFWLVENVENSRCLFPEFAGKAVIFALLEGKKTARVFPCSQFVKITTHIFTAYAAAPFRQASTTRTRPFSLSGAGARIL